MKNLAIAYAMKKRAHKVKNEMALKEDDRKLGQHGEMEEGPEGNHPGKEDGYAKGGEVHPHESKAHEMDMVGRIMKQRECMYSEGGKVANATPIVAGFEPNEFDDLVLDDHLEPEFKGAGNEHGDKFDSNHKDVVERIMMKRKHQHNPKPA